MQKRELKVRLICPQGQAVAVGAKTRVYCGSDDGKTLLGLREARSSNGYLGQNNPVLRSGLGLHRQVDVIVTFLDGKAITRTGAAANQTIAIDGRKP